MYVIFPLEDLLDPNSGLSRRSNKPQLHVQLPPITTEKASQKTESSSTSFETSVTNTPSSSLTVQVTPSTPTSPSASPSILTGNISRSGSIKSESKVSSSALKAAAVKETQSNPGLFQKPPVFSNKTDENHFKSSTSKLGENSLQINRVPASVQKDDTNKSSPQFDGRNSWPRNTNRKESFSGGTNSVQRSSSVRSKQINISHVLPDEKSTTTVTDNSVRPKRKIALGSLTATAPPTKLSSSFKDLVIKQKSELNGAKDCSGSIFAKEFNHENINVKFADAITLENNENATKLLPDNKSSIGLNSRTGGLNRENSFGARDLNNRKVITNKRRDLLSTEINCVEKNNNSSFDDNVFREALNVDKCKTDDSEVSRKIVGNHRETVRKSSFSSHIDNKQIPSTARQLTSLPGELPPSAHLPPLPSSKVNSPTNPIIPFHQSRRSHRKVVEDLSEVCPPPKFARDLSLQSRKGSITRVRTISETRDNDIQDTTPLSSRKGSIAKIHTNCTVGEGSTNDLAVPLKRKESAYLTSLKAHEEDRKAQIPLMAAMCSSGEAGLKHMTHPGLNETLKSQCNVTFKLLKTVSDFSAQLARLNEHHAEQLQHLVHTFRKKNSELRNERPTPGGPVAQTWEALLQEVETDSRLHVDLATTLTRDVSRPLVENTFYRKIEARKVFAHREGFDVIIGKAEEQLRKHKKDYSDTYRSHCSQVSNDSMARYLNSHNTYVTQLRATNGMLTEYHTTTLPSLMQELETVLTDVGTIASKAMRQASELIAAKTGEQNLRYLAMSRNFRNVNGRSDVVSMVKNMEIPSPIRPLHRFTPPSLPSPSFGDDGELPPIPQDATQPTFHNEVIEDRLATLSVHSKMEEIGREEQDLKRNVQQNLESCDSLKRAQQRSLDAGLHNKANELQEDISMKRFDTRVAQLHLGAIKAQKELFSPRDCGGTSSDRKMSGSGSSGMKSKWMKAFKSLKNPSSTGGTPKEPTASDRWDTASRRGIGQGAVGGGRLGDMSPTLFENSHIFQEYTYKKISACDVCHQILKGHSRQGLKCKLCKVNVHPDCQGGAPRCQPKSRLLRRQRSTSEIEARQMEPEEEESEPPNLTFNSLIASQPGRRTLEPPSPTGHGSHDHDSHDEVDIIYKVLKQAGDLGGRRAPYGSVDREIGGSSTGGGLHHQYLSRGDPDRGDPRLTGDRITSERMSGSSGALHYTPSAHHHHSHHRLHHYHTPSSSSHGLYPGGSSQQGPPPPPHHSSHHGGSASRMLFQRTPSSSANLSVNNGESGHPSSSAPMSPHRRYKMGLRFKSLSLDNPDPVSMALEAEQQAAHPSTSNRTHLVARHHGIQYKQYHRGSLSSLSRRVAKPSPCFCPRLHSYTAPSSPVTHRRIVSGRNTRMSSVELPDDNEKSLSSASTSPCLSPVNKQKPHRLLPQNLYVVLYNFTARHSDEMDLRAGNKVTVTDTSDIDWWQGKCLGRFGIFPSKYVTRLNGGERPLQVTRNLQVTDGTTGLKLLRDQIVIQIAEEIDGMVMIRNGDHQQGVCPVRFLQEI